MKEGKVGIKVRGSLTSPASLFAGLPLSAAALSKTAAVRRRRLHSGRLASAGASTCSERCAQNFNPKHPNILTGRDQDSYDPRSSDKTRIHLSTFVYYFRAKDPPGSLALQTKRSLRPNDRPLDQSPSRAAGRLGPPPTRLLLLPRFRVAYSAPAPAHRRSCRRRAAGPGCGPSSRGARPPGRAARHVPSRVCGPGLQGERAVSRRGT